MSAPLNPKRRWSLKQLVLLRELKECRNLDWDRIAARFPGRTAIQCKSRYQALTAESKAKIEHRIERRQITDRQEAQREALFAGYGARDLTQTFFNDPPRRFSALDQRVGGSR